MRLPFLKTTQERRLERRMKLRTWTRQLEGYLRKLDGVRRRHRDLLAKAVASGNESTIRSLARVCAGLGLEIDKANARLIQLESLDARADLAELNVQFTRFLRDTGREMLRLTSATDVTGAVKEMERGCIAADQLDLTLDALIDQAGLDHWNGSTVGGTEIDAIIHEASAAAEVTGSELEARIAAELAEARQAMECV
jgi:hypothetical protein